MKDILTDEQMTGFCLGNALKYLWRAGKKDDFTEDIYKAIWYLNYLTGAQSEDDEKMSEWISVKDKMPEKGTYDRYLVHVENVTNFNRLLDNIIIALWCCDDWLYDGWEDNRVTHWMPLPPKPESIEVQHE